MDSRTWSLRFGLLDLAYIEASGMSLLMSIIVSLSCLVAFYFYKYGEWKMIKPKSQKPELSSLIATTPLAHSATLPPSQTLANEFVYKLLRRTPESQHRYVLELFGLSYRSRAGEAIHRSLQMQAMSNSALSEDSEVVAKATEIGPRRRPPASTLPVAEEGGPFPRASSDASHEETGQQVRQTAHAPYVTLRDRRRSQKKVDVMLANSSSTKPRSKLPIIDDDFVNSMIAARRFAGLSAPPTPITAIHIPGHTGLFERCGRMDTNFTSHDDT